MKSDDGSQFASFAWTDRLRRSGIRISMNGEGVRLRLTLDNIPVARPWRTVKQECVDLHTQETGPKARAGARDWMEFYHHSRA